MSLPYSDTEKAAGLDQLDQPWPAVKMERAMTGRADVPISQPSIVPMSQERPDDVGGELMVYVPASTQPKDTHLSGDGERLEELLESIPRYRATGEVEGGDAVMAPAERGKWVLFDTLDLHVRHLATRLSPAKDRCPTCLSSNPYWTQCIDRKEAEEETGREPPERSARGGCLDPWHEERIAATRLSPESPCVAVTHDESDCKHLPVADRCKNCAEEER